ncbi:MAG: cupin domain-containing protein [Bacteroidota bacterium]
MNEIIKNKGTGDQIEFLQTDIETGGRMSNFIMTLAPKSSWAKSPRHFHPFQIETFEVISGELNLTVGNQHYVLRPGSGKKVVDKFVLHSFWNDTNEPVKFVAEIYPPKNIEKGLRLTYQLSQQGKISKRNIPYNPFYTLILMDYFDAYFSFIPWKFQRAMFKLGAKVAHLFGYK